MPMNPEHRRAMIAKIKIAQKALAMNDDSYRALLTRVTGKGSAAALEKHEMEAVLREMQRLGWKPVNPQGTRPRVASEKDRTIAKIGAILKELNLSWNYAHGMAKAMFARERVEWLDAVELHKLMQALAVYQRRQRVRRAQAQEAK
ncbi:gp16 family protein [Cardiobacterium hominis]|uniref:gp16 family protein n=1 Tax=Cardiobacterium hominis TaxID=2718 RepID=UPI0028D1AB1D|nr:phage protein GemA/Gp16 family protein [Cardiobacterium hominis]